MKNNWQKVKLGDICNINNRVYSISENWNFVNYLDTGNITKNIINEFLFINLKTDKLPSRARRKVKNGNIIYSTVRPNQEHYGYIVSQPKNLLVSTAFAVLDINPECADSKFIYYLITQTEYTNLLQSVAEQSTTAYPSIKPSDITSLEIIIPPIPMQKKIAGILSALDDKIELNNKINRNLEAQAQAIFKSWFIDFEPFKNGRFIDSELGKIPEDWRVVKFSEFLKPRIEKINNSTITEYSVTNSGIFKRDEKFKKRLSGAKTFNKIIYYADMVFGMSREILNWGLMRDQIGSVSSAYTVFSVNTELVDLSYLEFFMRYHHEYFKSIIRLASREGQGIDKAVLFNKCVIIPDTNAIARFLEILNSISNSRLAINEESRRLAQLRDALLPKLMSAEIDVSNVAV